ncbi:MAG: hypothetical protein FWD16_02170 [Clostridia bacterium]|nr:hypothetical protein [Clostridia bacterium]
MLDETHLELANYRLSKNETEQQLANAEIFVSAIEEYLKTAIIIKGE